MGIVKKSIISGLLVSVGVFLDCYILIGVAILMTTPLFPAMIKPEYRNLIDFWYNFKQDFKIFFWNLVGVCLVFFLMKGGNSGGIEFEFWETLGRSGLAGIIVGMSFKIKDTRPWITLGCLLIMMYAGFPYIIIEIARILRDRIWAWELFWYLPTCFIGNYIGAIISRE